MEHCPRCSRGSRSLPCVLMGHRVCGFPCEEGPLALDDPVQGAAPPLLLDLTPRSGSGSGCKLSQQQCLAPRPRDCLRGRLMHPGQPHQLPSTTAVVLFPLTCRAPRPLLGSPVQRTVCGTHCLGTCLAGAPCALSVSEPTGSPSGHAVLRGVSATRCQRPQSHDVCL